MEQKTEKSLDERRRIPPGTARRGQDRCVLPLAPLEDSHLQSIFYSALVYSAGEGGWVPDGEFQAKSDNKVTNM